MSHPDSQKGAVRRSSLSRRVSFSSRERLFNRPSVDGGDDSGDASFSFAARNGSGDGGACVGVRRTVYNVERVKRRSDESNGVDDAGHV